jgi:transposase-like protein
MNMIERGRDFVQKLRALVQRTVWDWRHCPRCGGTCTIKNGGYWRRPWTSSGRQRVRLQRHRCYVCGRSYVEEQAWLVRGSWYARAVHRQAVDWWLHGRSTLRRIAEMLRSTMGQQERWLMWHCAERVRSRCWEEGGMQGASCHFGASTLQRWLDGAGRRVREQASGQWAGVTSSGQMGTDGLWARFRARGQGVVLGLVDSVTQVVWAVVVAAEEESTRGWEQLFEAAKAAGLAWETLNGLTSDGAQGLLAYLRRALGWVHHQRCVWHFWRSLAPELARAVAQGVKGLAADAAKRTAQTLRRELTALLHTVIDAPTGEQAEQALQALAKHPQGQHLAQQLNEQLDRLLFYRLDCHRGLVRTGPEWLWRDFRARPSRGRNHGTDVREERATSLWMVYHNFTPAQRRLERKRHYKHPGQSPLEVAGSVLEGVSYLDALQI